MNVIFLTLVRIFDIEEHGIYQDLMRKFRDEGHSLCVVTPCERRLGGKTSLVSKNGVKLLNVRTLNIQKSNIIEKGIGTLLLEQQFKKAVNKYLHDQKFDLILYTTPPITLVKIINYLKKKNPQAISYLLLKDIFPQNAVDIEMFSKGSLFNKYFRGKEIALYKASDYIGCMSPANVDYLLKHNNFIDYNRVEVAPNSIELKEVRFEDGQVITGSYYIRNKYNLPTNLPIFIYGGNLGKPQGINYLLKCLEQNKNRKDCFFVIVGNGTEYDKLSVWCDNNKGCCVKIMQRLPKEDYNLLVRSCDVGLVFLDYRFTIPNYPSRLLGYMENKMPVICATDVNTDVGKIAEENGYGYWCESRDPSDFTSLVDRMLQVDRKTMGECAYKFLRDNYQVENTYQRIVSHL